MTFFRLDNKWFMWPLFLFLFSYLLLRAWFVEPLLDELGTLYFFIQTGYYPGHGAVLDANNHILNSFISNGLYRFFGDHFMVYRLFALSTFPLYFFATKKLVQQTISSHFSVLVFSALVFIHWIFDYFGFTRGYGPSLAFLTFAFYQIVQLNKFYSNKRYALIALLFFLALLSNLSLFIPITLLFFYLQLNLALNWKRQYIWSVLISFVYLVLMVPVYIYLNKLKNSGALWWGSTDGLWEVSGKSLTKVVLFSESVVWKYVLLTLIFVAFVLFILQWRKTGFLAFLRTATFWIPGLFFLCLSSAVFMAEVMKINYPMDRVGMYLVPLFILVLGLLFSDQKQLRWTLLILLWFPLSFVWKMNLNNSIFSPEDRIHRSFYEKLNSEVTPDDVLSADYVSHASYAYLTRKDKVAHLAVEYVEDENLRGDYHLSWLNLIHWKNYRCMVIDKLSSTRLYKKQIQHKRQLILDTIISSVTSKKLEIPLLTFNLRKAKRFTAIQARTEATIHLEQPSLGLDLRHEIQSPNSVTHFLQTSRFDWYFGHKKNYSFNFPNHCVPIAQSDEQLRIYMMNKEFRKVRVTKIHIWIYGVIQ